MHKALSIRQYSIDNNDNNVLYIAYDIYHIRSILKLRRKLNRMYQQWRL